MPVDYSAKSATPVGCSPIEGEMQQLHSQLGELAHLSQDLLDRLDSILTPEMPRATISRDLMPQPAAPDPLGPPSPMRQSLRDAQVTAADALLRLHAILGRIQV